MLRPAFQMAVDDDLILKNPFGFELGTILVNDSQKREAVSLEDEARFLVTMMHFIFCLKLGLEFQSFADLPCEIWISRMK